MPYCAPILHAPVKFWTLGIYKYIRRTKPRKKETPFEYRDAQICITRLLYHHLQLPGTPILVARPVFLICT